MKLNIKNEHNQTFDKINNLQVGTEVKLVPMLNELNTGVSTEDLYVLYNNKIYLKDYYVDETTYYVLGLRDTDEYNRDFELHQFEVVNNKENNLNDKGVDNMSKEEIIKLIREELNKELIIPIKYHDKNMPRMKKLKRGNWIDCRIIEGGKITKNKGTDKEIKINLEWEDCERLLEDGTIEYTKKIVYKKGDFLMLPLGFSINQPKGYEVNILPRSSTFKNFGIIQANSMAIGDDTYIGDDDMYYYPALALTDGEIYLYDRICQMQINKTTNLVLNEVNTFNNNNNRGGFGVSGVR